MSSKLNSISKAGTSRQCELCGGKLQSNNRYGVCQRTSLCKSENHRRYREAHREKSNVRERRYREANRERINAQRRLNYKANPEKTNARHRLYYKANPEKNNVQICRYREVNREKIAAQRRLYDEANRERINMRNRLHREANRERINMRNRLYREANRERINAQRCVYDETNRALRGGISGPRNRGHLHQCWCGGMMMCCAVPGCCRVVGWKTPLRIKTNKTGFRCPAHRYVRLPEIKEQDYDYQTPEELQSSVA